MNCHNDYLRMSSSSSNILTSSSSSSSSSKSISPPLNQSSKQQQQQQLQQPYSSPPINILRSSANNMIRKRSIGGLNNPPLPIPMQPLHESETTIIPSPQYSSVPQNFNLMRKVHHHHHHQQQQQQNMKFKLKQSAPVNMPPQSSSNRYRTLSCGSTGSFSASSSFSSSFGTSPIVTNQQAAFSATTTGLWKKMLSNNPSGYSSTTTGNYTTCTSSCSNSSVSSICTFRGTNNNDDESAIDQQPSTTICSVEDKIVASSGNMFHKRDDWSILSRIPINKQNTIHIRLEDEGPYGNDEVRCYVLSHFSSLGVRDIKCVLCDSDLKLYDRFPLIDGTLFLSPIIYETAKAINSGHSHHHNHHRKEQFVYGVCLQCLSGETGIKCKWCDKIWNSESLQIGTLYKYDVFAAFPCCQKRLCCNKCTQPVVDINDQFGQLPYFSSYSEEIECQHCKYKSHHFIKPLDMVFNKLTVL